MPPVSPIAPNHAHHGILTAVPALPPFTEAGDLPTGVYRVTLEAALLRLGAGTARRLLMAERLRRVYEAAMGTRHVARFVVFGSFVSDAPSPNDVDVFLLMDDSFDAGNLSAEESIVFDHPQAQAHFGASVFWVRRLAALDGEDAAISDWQIKREGTRRGILEIVSDDS